MTRQRSFKRLVRERMAKTGERYTTARRQLLLGSEARTAASTGAAAAPSAAHTATAAGGSGFLHLPGINPETSALRVLLANRGVTLPHSGETPTEAMVLGIGGGIGAGVFAFRYDTFSSLFLSGRHLWQDGHAFVVGACQRLGLPYEVRETGGARAAVAQLEGALAEGPALAWLDVTRLPYRGNVGHQDESSYHAVTVYAHGGGEALIGDLAPEPIRVGAEALAAARGRVRKVRHRLLTVGDPGAPVELETAIRRGLRACVSGLDDPGMGRYSGRFRLGAFETLADSLRAGGKQGWATVFPRGRRLWGALCSLYRYLEHEGSGGGLLRPLYADFLEEAAEPLGDPALREAAKHYRELGVSWSELALAALPEGAPLLADARELIDGIDEAFFAASGAAGDELRERRSRLRALADEAEAAFPLSESETEALLAELEVRLRELHRRELEGLTLLRAIAAG